jgi:integrase
VAVQKSASFLPRVRDADFVASVPSIPKLANERTAEFTALRASGLRGLRWDDVDLKRGELHARRRADRHGTIGRPKSEAGDSEPTSAPQSIAIILSRRTAVLFPWIGFKMPTPN